MYDVSKLALAAREARKKSYSPYSSVSVGAALLASSGEIYTGANVENAAFSPSVCAERVAILRAVHEGKRSFKAIAVCGGRSGELSVTEFTPCGVCRQTLAEFCGEDFEVVCATESDVKIYKLSELLPHSFTKGKL